MIELKQNADEFYDSAEDNCKKKRWNVAVSDYFKALATYCDYVLYQQIKRIPKNHTDRFELLKVQFPKQYQILHGLFELYRKSYNLRLTEKDAKKVKEATDEIRAKAT